MPFPIEAILLGFALGTVLAYLHHRIQRLEELLAPSADDVETEEVAAEVFSGEADNVGPELAERLSSETNERRRADIAAEACAPRRLHLAPRSRGPWPEGS